MTVDPFNPNAAAPASAAAANGGFDPSSSPGAAEEVDVDFSGTSDDFVQLDDGWYKFRLETATARADNGGPLLSKSGNPCIKWVARVVDGPRANTPMHLTTVTNGPGAFSLRRFINHAFGANLGKEPMRLNLGLFVGKEYWGQIGAQKNDATFKEYKAYRPINDPPPDLQSAGIASKI